MAPSLRETSGRPALFQPAGTIYRYYARALDRWHT